MEEIRETGARRQGGARLKKGGKGPLIALGVVLAVLAAAYLGVCAYAGSLETFYPNTTINGVDVGGQTPDQAGETLRTSIPKQTLAFCLPLTDETGGGTTAPEGDLLYGDAPACTRTYEDLGITSDLDYGVSAQFVFDKSQGEPGFLADGWYFLKTLVGNHGAKGILLDPEEHILTQQMQQLAEDFSREPLDTAHAVAEGGLEITMAQNGLAVTAAELTEETRAALREGHTQVLVEGTILPAQSLTAQELYDQVSGEVKNAGYNAKTESIVPEQIGAEFDVTAAQAAMDAAAPGETITIPAQVELPPSLPSSSKPFSSGMCWARPGPRWAAPPPGSPTSASPPPPSTASS